MNSIEFEYERLSKHDQKVYDAMNTTERERYESIWKKIEELKLKQTQHKASTKERVAREKKSIAEKQRRDRVHRLIERGAILEHYLDENKISEFSNQEIKEIIEKAMKSPIIRYYIQELRDKRQEN